MEEGNNKTLSEQAVTQELPIRKPPKNPIFFIMGVIIALLVLLLLFAATPLRETFMAKKGAPEISLEVVTGPSLEENGKYRIEVQALVSGNPTPTVTFSRDDSLGDAGAYRAILFLEPGESYNLTAAASNSQGRQEASLNLLGALDLADNGDDKEEDEESNGDDASEPTMATIEGSVTYPSSGIPPGYTVVVEDVATGREYSTDDIINDSKYRGTFGFIIQVPPGSYYIYATVPGMHDRAYYDEHVRSNYTVDSTERIVVTVVAGDHVDDVIVGNWYGPRESHSPVIAGIVLPTSPLYVNTEYFIEAQASDPEGYPISYQWQITSGGWLLAESTTPFIYWRTPSEMGRATIRVVVRNSIGGEAVHSETVLVNPITSLTALPAESGRIIKDKTAQSIAHVYAGDDDKGNLYRGFVSFDVDHLTGARIHKVELSLANPTVKGSPTFMHADVGGKPRGLWIETVNWGSRALELRDYNLTGTQIVSLTNYSTPQTITSVMGGIKPRLAEELHSCLDAGMSRFQLRLRFENERSNNDKFWDGVEYTEDNITLKIWYEYFDIRAPGS